MNNGEYTLIDSWWLVGADLKFPVEGFREGWQNRLIGNYRLLKGKSAKRGFLTVLYCLRADTLPRAYLRSLPVARFQAQLDSVIWQLEKEFDTEFKAICNACGDWLLIRHACKGGK